MVQIDNKQLVQSDLEWCVYILVQNDPKWYYIYIYTHNWNKVKIQQLIQNFKFEKANIISIFSRNIKEEKIIEVLKKLEPK